MHTLIPTRVLWVLGRLAEKGFTAHCVGGCVRDMLLHQTPKDWDVCTNALPQAVTGCFPDARVIPTGEKHGTVTVLSDGMPVEVTTYRVDGAYTDRRRPDSVAFTGCLTDDLSRRDFTINAMALSLTGELTDPFGGRADLSKGLIRCVGEARKRFEEDALRLLRALRFAARFRFAIEQETAEALLACRDSLRHVSVERVLAEFSRTDFSQVEARFLPVLQVVIPELKALNVHSGLPCDPAIQLAALLSGLPAKAILSRLKASNALTERVTALVLELPTPVTPDAPSARRLLSRIGPEAARQLLVLQQNPEAMAALEEALARGDCYSLSMLAIGGDDLQAAGLTGSAIGQALNTLLHKVIEGELPNDREALLGAVFFDSGGSS